jgi:hypothetical protein
MKQNYERFASFEVYVEVSVVPLRIGCTELNVPHLAVDQDIAKKQQLDSGGLSKVHSPFICPLPNNVLTR